MMERFEKVLSAQRRRQGCAISDLLRHRVSSGMIALIAFIETTPDHQSFRPVSKTRWVNLLCRPTQWIDKVVCADLRRLDGNEWEIEQVA